MPGTTAKMDPRPDHGESSYRGSGKLTGKKAVITGADSRVAREVYYLVAESEPGEARSEVSATSRRKQPSRNRGHRSGSQPRQLCIEKPG
jgi:hypothetical protein